VSSAPPIRRTGSRTGTSTWPRRWTTNTACNDGETAPSHWRLTVLNTRTSPSGSWYSPGSPQDRRLSLR
jgi:hypothetical protein